MKRTPVRVVLYIRRSPDGGFIGEFRGRFDPPYPGVSKLDAPAFVGATQGESFEQCFDNLVEAVKLYLEDGA